MDQLTKEQFRDELIRYRDRIDPEKRIPSIDEIDSTVTEIPISSSPEDTYAGVITQYGILGQGEVITELQVNADVMQKVDTVQFTYTVLHELCHFIYDDHGELFFQQLQKFLRESKYGEDQWSDDFYQDIENHDPDLLSLFFS